MAAQLEDGLTMLEVKGLTGGYGRVPILHGVDFSIQQGEIVGVLGHNGMGKTTLLKTLMGYLRPTGGSIRFDGEDCTSFAPHERALSGIGYVPQGRGIFPKLSVRENLRFAYHDVGEADEATTLAQVVARFPRLEPLMDRDGGALSGGEQQLLALARSLMGTPSLLLLDEPTEGVQPSIVEEIADTLKQMRAADGITILVVEQDLDFIADLVDRALVLERGRIVADLAAAELAVPGRVEAFLGFGAARKTAATSIQSIPLVTPPAPLRVANDLRPQPRSAAMAGGTAQASGGVAMAVRRPTLDQMRNIAEGLHLHMSDEELLAYMRVMEGSLQLYDRIAALPDELPEVKYPRTPGYRPPATENPLNAWYYKTEVRGSPAGPLRGKRIALKDTVCLAGVPMMNGASVLEGYVPDIDATIVTRMLDAGAIIAGKASCEYLCLSGGSHTNATGPVHNPYKLGYAAGGSSSGSAALVAAGEVDMAIGGDQGGSIRIPSSMCGCYGMKPTHGLVPYTGIMSIEATIDTVGPITRSVEDNAVLLEVIAGQDGLDPRQYAPQVDKYTAHLSRGVSGLRIAAIEEGFGWPGVSESDVDAKVTAAAERFKALGAQVDHVSLPIHRDGQAIWTPIALEGLVDFMMHGNGFGTNWRGLYVTGLIDFYGSGWRMRADELSPSLKICMLIGEYFLKHHRGRFYAKAQNIGRRLRAAYDDLLRRYDLLLMPTLPQKPQPLPPADAPLDLYIQRAFEMVSNTAAFSTTGHPAMNVPCGMSEGLPIGMMLVGKYYDEATIYRAAYAFEQSGDWRRY